MDWSRLPVKPYYSDSHVAIIHADCREVLPMLGPVDLVLTDPPYGVGIAYGQYEDTPENWRGLMAFLLPWVQAHSAMAILPAARIVELPWIYAHFPPDWLMAWHKGSPGTSAWTGFNDWEPLLVYGKAAGVQMHDYLSIVPDAFDNGHPCPKPIRWAAWLISRASREAAVILDPFMGSGTTLRAAKDLGRYAIGIEIEEKYCEIAAKRMLQGVLPLEIPERNEQGVLI